MFITQPSVILRSDWLTTNLIYLVLYPTGVIHLTCFSDKRIEEIQINLYIGGL